jgi:hypothetical protein
VDPKRIAKSTKLFTTTSDRENIVGAGENFNSCPLIGFYYFSRKGQVENFSRNENSAATSTNRFYVVIPKNLTCELEAMGISLPILI